jgi:hypothetical protein
MEEPHGPSSAFFPVEPSPDERLGRDSDEDMAGIDDDEEDFSKYTQG